MSGSSSGLSGATTASTSTFVTALIFNGAVFGAELIVFTLVRPYFPAIYQPRSYIPPEDKRSAPLSDNPFLWPLALARADHHEIKDKNGLDAYFFVRFLRMMCRVFLPVWLVSWLILMPVDSVGNIVAGHSGVDKFTFGNIEMANQTRYWAHLVLAWIFTIWLWWNIRHEMGHFVTTRQRWLISPSVSSSAQASTILVSGVPQRYLTESALMQLFSHLPGGVSKVWLNRDLKEMPDLYDRRLAACKKLESAETNLLNTAVKLRNKRQKAEGKAAKKQGKKSSSPDTAPRPSTASTVGRPLTQSSIASDADVDAGAPVDPERGPITLAEKLVPTKKRPSHRLPLFSWMPSLPLIGKEVDTIDWARDEIAKTNAALRDARRTLAQDVARSSGVPPAETNHPDALKADPSSAQTYPPLNSAFILFNTQVAAHLAAQSLTHHAPYRMAGKQIGVAPDDVIWGNLNLNPYEARVRQAISWGITLGLIILWAFPVAFVGIVSNVHGLCAQFSWLAWLCELPSPVVGIISGILPPVLLAVLMMLLPIILRLLARFEGMPKKTAVELSLMDRYFLFEVINSFLIVTISSGIIAALPSLLNDPGNIPSLLAQHLPQASTFFLTYVILQGLSGTASGFLQVVPLVLYYVKLFVLGSTPRSIYKIKYTLRSVKWGTLFPMTTLLVVISWSYSIISPIINGLACVTFFLLYCMWKYLFTWQLEQPQSGETGGLFFPKAIQQVFVGMYLQQICLTALFFLATNDDNVHTSIPEGALMIVLIAFTAFFNVILNNSYGPLTEYLPLTLAESAHGAGDDNRRVAERERDDQASVGSADYAAEKRASSQCRRRSRAPSTAGSVANADPFGKPLPPATVDSADPEDPERGRGRRNSSPRMPQVKDFRDPSADPAEEMRGVDEEAGPKDFYHPASVEPQPVVWLPRDPLGLSMEEEAAIRERGIAVSTESAVMDDKGHVDIDGAPPGAKTSL
ncbi:hypothetical protein CERSUDRAFT_116206 [Gelatoporia subvermispora B]|uniref:DUF221-domain-containing protein n=1 Tax=Ceriporiopsis subvermispora (strain B) TaxID=914234 RepID=M2RAK1_CERS8|nr:hypothetical protein CERSUDRAFT_116206 [Gelatoporia subvermispora B]